MTTAVDSFLGYWLAWITAASWQIALFVSLILLAAWVARRASPRIRYALWLLVLVKIFLPPSIAIFCGVGSWGLSPLWNEIQPTVEPIWDASTGVEIGSVEMASQAEVFSKSKVKSNLNDELQSPRIAGILFVVWAAGCTVFFLVVLQRYSKLRQSLNRMISVDEGPLRIRFEKIALELNESNLPELYLSEDAASPYLFGFKQPIIVLPRQIVEQLSPADINSVLLHELNHWRRRDPWVGWLQMLAQGLFWFHPFVWLANTRLRHERECVCDEAVLRSGKCEPASYGEALLSVLKAAKGRSSVQGSLVGVFEPGASIQTRLEEIMNFRPEKRSMGLPSILCLVGFALLFLPMALPVAIAKTEAVEATKSEKDSKELLAPRAWPWIVSTVPPVGATEVDPNLKEVSLTFDRDMQSGMSWTGSPTSYMPHIPQHTKPYWKDRRTCVLPVELEKGTYYRVGINSKSFRKFRSEQGQSAPCAVIYFTTQGASKSVQSRVRVPKPTKNYPANGASDVSPGIKAIRVTFDMPMSQGMSWTGSGPNFPQSRPGTSARWNSSRKSCTLPVALKPNHEYRLGLNSYAHINFQSKWGVPMQPVVYEFKTSEK